MPVVNGFDYNGTDIPPDVLFDMKIRREKHREERWIENELPEWVRIANLAEEGGVEI